MMKLIKPSLEQLDFRQALLADEATMSYNHAYGGCIDFPPPKWAIWYEKWLKSDHDSYFYRYLYNEELKAFVGEAAYRLENETNRHICDVIVHAKYRGRSFGREGLQLLCEAAKANGVAELYDHIAIDNPSLSLFLSCGFTEVKRDVEAVTVKKIL